MARMGANAKKRLPRRSVDETRRAMLDAAVRLVLRTIEEPAADVLTSAVAHIRVTDVVVEATRVVAEELGERAEEYHPFSIGALYHVWPTQTDFQNDLLLHLAYLSAEVVPTIATTAAQIESGLVGEELLYATLRTAWEHTRNDPLFRAMLGAYPYIANEEIRRAIAYQLDEFFTQVARAWRHTLSASGREMRPPFTIEDLARAVAALIGGFALQWLANPTKGLADPVGDPAWDLPTRSIEALIEAFTVVTRTRTPTGSVSTPSQPSAGAGSGP